MASLPVSLPVPRLSVRVAAIPQHDRAWFEEQLTRSTLQILSWFTGRSAPLAWAVVLILFIHGFTLGLLI